MAKIVLCSNGWDISDQVFEIELLATNQIHAFIRLVREGGSKSGLIMPALRIESNGNVQFISQRNDWTLDESKL